MSKIKQGGLSVLSMQCNVKGDDEALSLNTMKETKWLNHMKQNVEDHQQRERERDKEDMQSTVAKQAGNGKAPKNTTAIVSWSAYHEERQKRENPRWYRCCLFLQKLLTL